MNIADLEKLFDVKLDGLKKQLQDVHKRVDNLISVVKWSVGIILSVITILVAIAATIITFVR